MSLGHVVMPPSLLQCFWGSAWQRGRADVRGPPICPHWHAVSCIGSASLFRRSVGKSAGVHVDAGAARRLNRQMSCTDSPSGFVWGCVGVIALTLLPHSWLAEPPALRAWMPILGSLCRLTARGQPQALLAPLAHSELNVHMVLERPVGSSCFRSLRASSE